MKALVVRALAALLIAFAPGVATSQRADDDFDTDRGPRPDRGVRLLQQSFSSVPQPAPIPGAQGATFCALTMVDDDSPRGFCRVTYDNNSGQWLYQTGGPGADNSCEVTCMWIGSDSRPQRRRRQQLDAPDERFPSDERFRPDERFPR